MKLKFKPVISAMVSIAMLFNISFTALAKGIDITIIHTNDTHGGIVQNDKKKIIGYSKISSYVSAIKNSHKNVLLIDAGDCLHGQIITGVSKGDIAIKIMNAMKYNYMVPGNHDFNYGLNRLIELSNKANFKVLAANIFNKNGARVFEDNDIFEMDGVKIGVFGIATPETMYKTNPANVKDLIFGDPVKCAKEQVEILKANNCDVIIAIAHLGVNPESAGYNAYDLRDKVDGIDLIIDGHSHTPLSKIEQAKDKPMITSAGGYGEFIGVTELTINDGEKIVESKNIGIDDLKQVENDKTIDSIIRNAEIEMKNILSKPIGRTDVTLNGKQTTVNETNLSKLLVDSVLDETKADMVILNGGCIRDDIQAGTITVNDLLTVFPFGHYVVTKSMKGEDIIKALEYGFSSLPDAARKLPRIANAKCVIDPNAEKMHKIKSLEINGEPIIPDKIYTVATNDFLAIGGDGYSYIANGTRLNEYSTLEVCLEKYISKIGGNIKSYDRDNCVVFTKNINH